MILMGLSEEILSDAEYTLISLMKKYEIRIDQATRKDKKVQLFFEGESIEVSVELMVRGKLREQIQRKLKNI